MNKNFKQYLKNNLKQKLNESRWRMGPQNWDEPDQYTPSQSNPAPIDPIDQPTWTPWWTPMGPGGEHVQQGPSPWDYQRYGPDRGRWRVVGQGRPWYRPKPQNPIRPPGGGQIYPYQPVITPPQQNTPGNNRTVN